MQVANVRNPVNMRGLRLNYIETEANHQPIFRVEKNVYFSYQRRRRYG